MVTVITPSGGMSVGTPFQQAGGRRPRRGGGGGSRGTTIAKQQAPPTVSVSGTTVTIGGQSFSVKPSEQAAFISQRGGAVSSTISSQILAAEKAEGIKLQALQEKEKAKKEKIFGGTIAGQLQAQPSSVGVPITDVGTRERIGLIPATFRSGKKLAQRIIPGGERPSFEEIIAPFDLTTKRRAEEEALVFPDGQIINVERLSGPQIKAFEKFAGGELQQLGEIQLGIEAGRTAGIKSAFETEQKGIETKFGELQSEIDVGRITLPQAEKLGLDITEKAQKSFEKEQEKIFKTSPDIKGIHDPKRSGVRTLVDIGLLSTPITSFTAAAVSSKQDPIKIDIEQLDRGVSIEGAITQRPGIRTGTFLLGGTIGLGGELAASGRAIELANIEEALRKASASQIGPTLPFPKGSLHVTAGIGRTSGAEAFETRVIASKLTPSGKFAVSGGRREVIVVGEKFFSGKQFIVGGSEGIGAGTKILPTTKDLSVGISKVFTRPETRFSILETRKGLTGDVSLFPGQKLVAEKDLFSGVSQKVGDKIFFTGGKISKGEKQFLEFAKGFEAPGPITLTVEQESRGVLQILKPGKKVKDVFSTTLTGGPKTPLSKTFGQPQVTQVTLPAPKISPPSSFAKVTEVAPSSLSPSLIGIPRSVGGAGLTEQQLIQGRGLTSGLSGVDSGQVFIPKTKDTGGLVFSGGLDVSKDALKTNLGIGGRTTGTGRVRDTTALAQAPIAIPSSALAQPIKVKQKQLQGLVGQDLAQLGVPVGSRFAPTAFDFGGFAFGFPPTLGGAGTRGRRKRRARPRVPIRPSLTGIILEIEPAAQISPTFGVVPGQIRGLATGFDVPTKKKKKSKKKKK